MSIKRRSFLKAAGVALPLPWLESLAGAAPSGANPGRAVFFMVPSGVNMWRWHPKEFGPDYQLSSTLQAFPVSLAGFSRFLRSWSRPPSIIAV